MSDSSDFDIARYEEILKARADFTTGPRNISTIEFDRVDTKWVDGKDLRPLTEDRASTLVQKNFPSHFNWSKPVAITLTTDTITDPTRRPIRTLFFALVIEDREASWRSSHGITRDFDSVFHCLDKWSANTPAMVLDSSSLQKTLEFEWTQTKKGIETPIKTHCLCWEHSADCVSCKGIASVE